MLSTHVLLLISLLAISASEVCVKYDFEEDFTAQFGFSEICENMVAARWYRGLYSWGVPASPHVQSRSFISPTASRISCTSSFPFEIQAGGLLEVNVHMQPTNDRDQISVMVYRKAASGSDQLVSSVISSRLSPNFKLGQNTLNITFPGTTETFEGYVIFLGLASTSSIILVDSFRYIPPNTLESSCVIYDEGITAAPTAIPTTSQTSISDTSTSDTSTSDTSTSAISTSETELTTTIAPDHACKTYEFGENFNTEFGNIGCNFLSSWELITNIPADVEKFHSESNSYISASSNLPSCTTSYTFPMRSDGYLEVNSYMGADDDRIYITVYESTTEGLIKTIIQREFTGVDYKNWQSLKIPLYSDDQADYNNTFTFIGYIQITGSSSTNSPVLVDSFRYYAPETENECQIYQESTTCKTYTFGSSFGTDFLNTGCTFLAEWKLVEEIPHDVVKFNTRSTSYIQAEENFPSCTTSYSFPMRTDGYLEVNSYMEAAGDMIHVTVYESASDGLFKIINEVQFNGSAHNSWNELRIPLTSTSDSYQSDDAIGNVFTGYITIIGSATSQSKVLVDSFRYYAPETESECQIYQDSTTCKIYQFGERFVTDFDQTGCLVLPEWTVFNNQYIIADKIFPSCTTSYNFRMRTDGYLEFKAQIDAGGLLHVTVYENLNDGLHRVIKEKEFVGPASQWTLLRVSLNPTEDGDEGSGEENADEDLEDEDDDAVETVHSTFMGYITIVGSQASVEAFRYFAPEVEEQCQIPTAVSGSTDASQPNLLSIIHQVMSQPPRSSYQDV